MRCNHDCSSDALSDKDLLLSQLSAGEVGSRWVLLLSSACLVGSLRLTLARCRPWSWPMPIMAATLHTAVPGLIPTMSRRVRGLELLSEVVGHPWTNDEGQECLLTQEAVTVGKGACPTDWQSTAPELWAWVGSFSLRSGASWILAVRVGLSGS